MEEKKALKNKHTVCNAVMTKSHPCSTIVKTGKNIEKKYMDNLFVPKSLAENEIEESKTNSALCQQEIEINKLCSHSKPDICYKEKADFGDIGVKKIEESFFAHHSSRNMGKQYDSELTISREVHPSLASGMEEKINSGKIDKSFEPHQSSSKIDRFCHEANGPSYSSSSNNNSNSMNSNNTNDIQQPQQQQHKKSGTDNFCHTDVDTCTFLDLKKFVRTQKFEENLNLIGYRMAFENNNLHKNLTLGKENFNVSNFELFKKARVNTYRTLCDTFKNEDYPLSRAKLSNLLNISLDGLKAANGMHKKHISTKMSKVEVSNPSQDAILDLEKRRTEEAAKKEKDQNDRSEAAVLDPTSTQNKEGNEEGSVSDPQRKSSKEEVDQNGRSQDAVIDLEKRTVEETPQEEEVDQNGRSQDAEVPEDSFKKLEPQNKEVDYEEVAAEFSSEDDSILSFDLSSSKCSSPYPQHITNTSISSQDAAETSIEIIHKSTNTANGNNEHKKNSTIPFVEAVEILERVSFNKIKINILVNEVNKKLVTLLSAGYKTQDLISIAEDMIWEKESDLEEFLDWILEYYPDSEQEHENETDETEGEEEIIEEDVEKIRDEQEIEEVRKEACNKWIEHFSNMFRENISVSDNESNKDLKTPNNDDEETQDKTANYIESRTNVDIGNTHQIPICIIKATSDDTVITTGKIVIKIDISQPTSRISSKLADFLKQHCFRKKHQNLVNINLNIASVHGNLNIHWQFKLTNELQNDSQWCDCILGSDFLSKNNRSPIEKIEFEEDLLVLQLKDGNNYKIPANLMEKE